MASATSSRSTDALRRGTFFLGLIALVLCLPSSNRQVFDGLPVSHPAEYVLGVLLLPFLFSRSARAVFDRWITRWPRGWRAVPAVALPLALGIKIVLVVSGDAVGLAGCYRNTGTTRPMAVEPAGPCEFSYENVLQRFASTRIDRDLDFEAGRWNLTFWNSNRFNFYQHVKGNPVRERMPFAVRWAGWVRTPGDGLLKVDYAGEGLVAVSGRTLRLDPSYAAFGFRELPVPAGDHPILIEYAFDDGSRIGSASTGPAATFHTKWTDARDQPANVAYGPAPRSRGWLSTLAIGGDLIMTSAALAIALFHLSLMARDRRWGLAAAAAVGLAALWPPAPALDRGGSSATLLLACIPVLLFVLARHTTRRLIAAWLVLVVLAAVALWPKYQDVSAVVLRGPGGDALTYESQARSIVDGRSLASSERVFYYQPLFRYILLAERVVLGDGDALLAVSIIAALTFAVIAGVCRARLRPAPGRTMVAATAGTLMLATVTLVPSAMNVALAGASEYPTWIMLSVGVPMLLTSRTERRSVWSAVLLAASGITRANQMPGILLVLAAWAIHNHRRVRAVAWTVGVFVVIALLPLAHNVYYGNKAVLFATSSTIPDNLYLTPRQLLDVPWTAEVKDLFDRQWRLMLGFDREGWLAVALRGLEGLWLAALGWTLIARRPRVASVALAAAPAAFLAVHLFYVGDLRHILAGHLMLGLVATLLVSGWPPALTWPGRTPGSARAGTGPAS